MPSSEVFVYFVFVLGNIDFEKMSFERIGRTGVWKKMTKAGAGAKPRKGETVFAHYVRSSVDLSSIESTIISKQ